MTIKKLPPDVIKLIAAGEVIDSMIAVVRELVENSLDANAKKIVVSIYPESWQVKVADNGVGMNKDNLLLCVEPYTTSKINSQQDLQSISTLGFRGEALHSIAQLADITIYSRDSEDIGWEICYEEGKIIKQNPIAIACGTIINVTNLFSKIPVRRQGNPSFSQQIKKITILIGQLALCHPQVTWQLLVNDRLSLQISKGKNAQNILPQLLKKVSLHDFQLVELDLKLPEENKPSFVELVLGLPDRLSRNKADWIKIGVNGRVVKIPELENVIFSFFKRILPRDRFPVLFFHLKTTSDQIDWNRHPAKAEIYLRNLNFWREKINTTLEQALRITPSQLPTGYQNKRIEKILSAAEKKGVYNLDKKEEKPQDKIVGLVELKAIAQLRNTYIIAEHENGMWLIEQHIAHERVLYEKLQDDWQIIPLQTPIILNNLSTKQVKQLKNLEIEIDSFGEGLWAIRSIPEKLASREDCSDALIELSWGGDLESAQVATACRTAIRNGTTLTLPEMQTLIDSWKITRNPHTCPHGRPIYLSLEESALYRFFRRSWVLGKSHGI